jgi:hypothetical protein
VLLIAVYLPDETIDIDHHGSPSPGPAPDSHTLASA